MKTSRLFSNHGDGRFCKNDTCQKLLVPRLHEWLKACDARLLYVSRFVHTWVRVNIIQIISDQIGLTKDATWDELVFALRGQMVAINILSIR